MITVTLEDTDFARVLAIIFGAPIQGDAALAAALQAITNQLQELKTMSDKLQAGLDQLTSDVAAQATVIASATTAFQGLSQQLADALAAAKAAGATDAQLAELTTLQQSVEANTSALAAAIPANTPAATPSPTPAPAPEPAPAPVPGA